MAACLLIGAHQVGNGSMSSHSSGLRQDVIVAPSLRGRNDFLAHDRLRHDHDVTSLQQQHVFTYRSYNLFRPS